MHQHHDSAASVGFVGLGNQGAPIAARIGAGGHRLIVWARRPAAIAPFRDAGHEIAESLADLGRRCPMIAICVTTDDDVRAVTLGPDALLASMEPGSTLAVHSTVHPDTIRQVHAAGAARGVDVLDAPVSGGNAGALAGQMTILCGGDTHVLERWRPVFATHAVVVELLGPIGAGQIAKLLSNALSSLTVGASMWALDSAGALGLDRDASYRILIASSGDNFMLRHVPAIEAGGASIAAVLLRKDLDLYRALVPVGDDGGVALSRTAHDALQMVEQLAASIESRPDHS